VRKDILEKINGYRTDFWPGEDTLLCKDIIDSGLRIVYDPWVVVHHHRRALFLPHLRQLGRYAFHRGYFVKRYPSNSMKLSYFIPSLFVAGIFAEVVFAALSYNTLATIGAAPLIVYFSILAITTFSLNPVSWILTAFGVLFTDLTYGVKFAHGLLSKRAPCEFIGKDHV
jgi:cellulose synthase/poly-beta-1,6-N-acetylglucosamine synthase-like glycosyltransferase